MDASILIIITLCLLLGYAFYNLANRLPCPPCTPCPKPTIVGAYTPVRQNIVEERDRRVLTDTLYPPINRDTNENTIRLLREPRLHPSQTQNAYDTYKLIGYLVNSQDKEDVWKLMARIINRSQAEFFAESSNRKLDIKVPLTSQTARAADGTNIQPFRDIDNMPDKVTIEHPMFDPTAIYNVVILPYSQLASGYI